MSTYVEKLGDGHEGLIKMMERDSEQTQRGGSGGGMKTTLESNNCIQLQQNPFIEKQGLTFFSLLSKVRLLCVPIHLENTLFHLCLSRSAEPRQTRVLSSSAYGHKALLTP